MARNKVVKQLFDAALSSDEDSSSSFSSTESSSSDDEDILYILELVGHNHQSRNCIQNYVENVVPSYSDREFITHFRLSRTLWMSLSQRFATSDIYLKITANDNSRASISPGKHILVFLWFAGHQTSSFRDVADRFDLCISSLHTVITRVCNFVSGLAPEYIKWPTDEDKAVTEQFYRENKGVPNVIGHIDGTHVQIDRPVLSPDDYINRKGVHTMVVQGVCNEKKKFTDIFIGYPGSVHDARVFRNSPLFQNLGDHCEGFYIFGDSAYPCIKSLLTPYRDNGHLTQIQKRFNKKLSSCRVDIEHTFGILKQRFRQLYHLKLKGHTRICHFIRACCVLHNIANMEDLEMFADEDTEEDVTPANGDDDRQELRDAYLPGRDLRDEIARLVFLRCH